MISFSNHGVFLFFTSPAILPTGQAARGDVFLKGRFAGEE